MYQNNQDKTKIFGQKVLKDMHLSLDIWKELVLVFL
jgi:hypothetical protein